MKVNNKTLTSALFALCALMFTVAVSGGCGGGGSGNPGANTAVEGFTNEYVSPDLLSAPDEFSSDDIFVSGDANANDEYGNGNYNVFTLLTKTTWSLGSIQVLDEAGDVIRTSSIPVTKNYNTNTITFLVSGNAMGWAKADDKKTPVYNDFTELFLDEQGNPQTAPIFRPANNFIEESKNYRYRADNLAANPQTKVGAGSETIEGPSPIQPTGVPILAPRELKIRNEFTAANNNIYEYVVNLKRVDLFSLLDQTDWQVKDMQVIGMVPGADGSYISGNPQNYNITDTDYLMNKPITLRTSIKNNIRVLEYTVNNKAQNFSTIKFIDKTLNQELIAPYLRAGSGFNVIEEYQPPFEERFQAVFEQHQFPGHEILYVTAYGPNAEIVIDNSVCYHEKINPQNVHHYWVRMKLTPYNPYSY